MVTLTGVAAIYYAVSVRGTAVLAQHEQSTVFWTKPVCVIVSILAEGVSATRLTRPSPGLIARHRDPYERKPDHPPPERHIDASKPGEKVHLDCF